jgi:tRNA(Ile)-lysidine synthase
MDANEQTDGHVVGDEHGPDWPALADRLAVRLPLERLHRRVVAELKQLAASDSQRLGIACSGGADSLCLLLLAWAQFPALRGRLAVLHFDHRIRGAESAADAQFVSEVAQALGLPCEQGVWDASTPDASEQAARDARMAFLHSKAQAILFGHNRTDVAETMLLRLGRGSSLDGLAGPRPVQRFRNRPGVVHLRPLLDLSGAQIREALRECGIPWREDSTNAGTKYARNKLRHEVLPLLDAALGRDWAAGAARSRERLDEADRMIETHADNFVGPAGGEMNLTPLRCERSAVVRRALEIWLARNGLRAKVAPVVVDELVAHVKNRIYDVTAYRAIGIEIQNDNLRLFRQSDLPTGWKGLRMVAGTEVFFPDGAGLRAEALRFAPGEAAALVREMKLDRNNALACLSLPCESVLELRTRMPGDAYRPLGSDGTIKLKDAFINRKICLAQRDHLPIVLVADRIAWCPMMPLADEFKVTDDTIEAIRLTYSPNQIRF